MKLIIAFIIENLNHPIFIVNVSVRGFGVMGGLRIFDCGGGGASIDECSFSLR